MLRNLVLTEKQSGIGDAYPGEKCGLERRSDPGRRGLNLIRVA